MSAFTFVTSNPIKISQAKHYCNISEIQFDTSDIDMIEIQRKDDQSIALDKAKQAYNIIKKPVVVTDDSWAIPGLNGFPGPYMKYVNEWLTPEDFLRLTQSLTDRRIFKHQHLIYKDTEIEKIISIKMEGVLLTEIRGESSYSHITIASYDGIHSIAENINAKPATTVLNVWEELCEWLNSKY